MTIPDDKQLGDALNEATRDLRPVDLWARLERPTAEIAAVHACRSRLQPLRGAVGWLAAAAAILVVASATFLTFNRVQPATAPSQIGERVATAQPTSPPPATVVGGSGGVLRYNAGAYPDNLDPHLASYTNEVLLLKMLYEGLTRLDTNLNVVGAAAESWKVADDGLTWTFTLRPGLKYSDGQPLTAKNFEYALKRAASPQVAGQYQSSTFDIAGAEAYGTADFKALTPEALQALRDRVHVKALDDRTLEVRTRQPIAYLPSLMSLWITYPVREDVVQRGEAWWNQAANHIGNGPFTLQQLTEKQAAALVPNPHYYTPPKLDRLEFRFIVESKVAFEAYKNGELDMIYLATEDLETALRDATLKNEIVRYGGACTVGIHFNQTLPPFNNREARLAFAQAIDRDQFVGDVMRGIGRPTTAWIPDGLPDHNPAAGADLKFNPTAARAAWQRVGYQGEIKLVYGASARAKTRFEFLADQFSRHLGAKIVLEPVDPTALAAMQKSLDTMPLVSLGGWCGDYPDPQNWMTAYWDSRAFAARYGYKNETVDRLQRAADGEPDALRRSQLYQDAEKLVLDDVAIAPLYHSENVFLVKPYVKGYVPTPQDHLLGEFSITQITAAR